MIETKVGDLDCNLCAKNSFLDLVASGGLVFHKTHFVPPLLNLTDGRKKFADVEKITDTRVCK